MTRNSKPLEPQLHLDEATAFAYLEHLFEAVICAHTAVEAYVNELLPADKVYVRLNRDGEAESLSKEEIERRASLIEKVGQYLPEALGKHSPKGIHRAYSDLRAVTKIRDRLIHMKSADRTTALLSSPVRIWLMPPQKENPPDGRVRCRSILKRLQDGRSILTC